MEITHKGAKSVTKPYQVKPNRRGTLTGVDAAASFDFRDEVVERIGIYSQRLAEVTAHSPAGGDRQP
ncbi:hypothetical protein [Shewanella woodyi]|uniref:hypothetical protein n=1 Tax=Shewanella woodyi TaxID=60961 RepID=UPI003749354B